MTINEKELEKDEKFVVEALAQYADVDALQRALTDYFHKKYERKGEVTITFDKEIHDWIVSTRKGEKRVGYVESIPKAVHDIL